jgi:hypothetical protein
MALGVVKGFDTWIFQESYVERVMDNAAYSAAHPDDTLVLAGPARKTSLREGFTNMMAIGMLQAVNFSSTKPTQPMMAIGSGRSFYVSGKAQTQWTMGRLFVNGRNLLRVLYHNAIAGGVDPSVFDDMAMDSAAPQYIINLDSELFLVPMGLGSVIRDKTHNYVGGFYAELCMITSYTLGWNAGQNLILENVSGLSDRLLPFGSNSSSKQPRAGVLKETLDSVLGFVDNVSATGGVGAHTPGREVVLRNLDSTSSQAWSNKEPVA